MGRSLADRFAPDVGRSDLAKPAAESGHSIEKLSMPLYKYFTEERFANAFIRKGYMRFGSLNSYRQLEDGGVRGDPKDGTLHYAPAGGIEITMVADGRKLSGVSFSTAAQNMFVYCMTSELSEERATELGPFCVEIVDPDAVVARLKARATEASRLDYAGVVCGETEYRPYDKIPGADWAVPERVVMIKPPEYASQKEFRIALPLKSDAQSDDDCIFVAIGKLAKIARLYRF